MVSGIAGEYNAALDAGDAVKYMAMTDAFYVHVRLLAEFLVKEGKKTDFAPSDFGVVWNEPRDQAAERLGRAWVVASQHVMHFSGKRLLDQSEEDLDFTVGTDHYLDLAADVLEVFSAFVGAVCDAAPAWDGGSRLPDPEEEPAKWEARVLSEVAGQLSTARDALSAVVG
jgi:hypothetical protein